jgi:hypothetical protein
MDSAEGCTEVLVGAAAIREHLQQLNRNVRAREHMRNDEKVGVEGGGGGGGLWLFGKVWGEGIGMVGVWEPKAVGFGFEQWMGGCDC